MDTDDHCEMIGLRYHLFGLGICTDLPLVAATRPHGDDPCDLRIAVGPTSMPPDGIPEGHPIAELVDDGERLYTVTSHNAGYTFRFHGLGDFDLTADLATLECRPGALLSPELAAILVTGTIVSFILGVRGAHVLHGSAVRTPLGAVAFVAGSGMGKSTMAAQFCARGAELLTDDVLVLALGKPIEVLSGSTELRLRARAASVVDDFGVPPTTRRTADERLAVRPAHPAGERTPLAAIVCPRPSARTEVLRLERMRPVDALWELGTWPRIAACDPGHIARQFEGNAAVSECVPVYKAHIPWGPPFSPATPDLILEHIAIAR